MDGAANVAMDDGFDRWREEVDGLMGWDGLGWDWMRWDFWREVGSSDTVLDVNKSYSMR